MFVCVVDAGLQVLGRRSGSRTGSSAGWRRPGCRRRCRESAPPMRRKRVGGLRSVVAVRPGRDRLGGRAHRSCPSGGFVRGSCVRRRHSPAPASRLPGTAAPTFRAARPARSGGVSLPFRRTAGQDVGRAGPDRLPLPAPGSSPLGAGGPRRARRRLHAGRHRDRRVRRRRPPGRRRRRHPRPALSAGRGPGARPAAGQQGRLAAHGQRRHRPVPAGGRVRRCSRAPPRGCCPRSPAGSPPGGSSPTT